MLGLFWVYKIFFDDDEPSKKAVSVKVEEETSTQKILKKYKTEPRNWREPWSQEINPDHRVLGIQKNN